MRQLWFLFLWFLFVLILCSNGQQDEQLLQGFWMSNQSSSGGAVRGFHVFSRSFVEIRLPPTPYAQAGRLAISESDKILRVLFSRAGNSTSVYRYAVNATHWTLEFLVLLDVVQQGPPYQQLVLRRQQAHPTLEGVREIPGGSLEVRSVMALTYRSNRSDDSVPPRLTTSALSFDSTMQYFVEGTPPLPDLSAYALQPVVPATPIDGIWIGADQQGLLVDMEFLQGWVGSTFKAFVVNPSGGLSLLVGRFSYSAPFVVIQFFRVASVPHAYTSMRVQVEVNATHMVLLANPQILFLSATSATNIRLPITMTLAAGAPPLTVVSGVNLQAIIAGVVDPSLYTIVVDPKTGCETLYLADNAVTGQTGLSVLASAQQPVVPCTTPTQQQPLSTAAIAGVAAGCAAVAVGAALLLLYCTRRSTAVKTKQMKAELKNRELEELQRQKERA